jgi:hypothetical protein
MSTEEVVGQEVLQPDVQEEVKIDEPAPVAAPNHDADLISGFNAANGIEEPVVKPEPEKVIEPKLLAGYTEEQIKELVSTVESLKQRESKIFGSMGAMKQTIEALRSQPAAQVSWSADKFKRLSVEYPEMAAALLDDLKSAGITASPDNQKLEELVSQRVQTSLDQSSRAYEAKLLAIQHRDWKQVVAADDFVGWKEALPQDDKTELDNSWDSSLIAQRISEFKEWKAKATQSKQTNQRRLEAAVAPKSSAPVRAAPSETDAFLAGFKSVRG